MLLDFTVENYRSIKEPVTLSAVAQRQSSRQTTQDSKRKRVKSDHEISPGYPVKGWDIELLPVLAIFGANASGKSNVIQALDYLLLLMAHGNQGTLKVQQVFKYAKLIPFKLDSNFAKKPTRFELRVAFDDAIYTYSLVLHQNHILLENLDYALAKTKRTRRLFHRSWDENAKKFIWKNGSDFVGTHTKLQRTIKENELYMSLIARLELDVVERLCSWFSSRWLGISLGS
ncbi:MAG TPA: ATP-binding protein, partial [Coleofasciculaceae cyanobacterium]